MHLSNREWLTEVSKKFPEHFNGAKVLELGSLDINGTARDYFKNCYYVGVDITPGKCVDVVCSAKDTQFEILFDTLITASMFEHDPTWKESFAHNLAWLRSGGLVLATWGAEGNIHHPPEPWKIVPVKDMEDFVKEIGILTDVDIFEEGSRYTPDCPGAWSLLARKL